MSDDKKATEQPKPAPLNRQQAILATANALMEQTLREYVSLLPGGPEQKKFIQLLCLVVYSFRPWKILSPRAAAEASKTIFSTPNFTDVLFTLDYAFFSKWGDNVADTKQLIDSLLNASMVSSSVEFVEGARKGERYNLIPTELLERLPTREDARILISNNRWIVIALLLQTGSASIIGDLIRKEHSSTTASGNARTLKGVDK